MKSYDLALKLTLAGVLATLFVVYGAAAEPSAKVPCGPATMTAESAPATTTAEVAEDEPGTCCAGMQRRGKGGAGMQGRGMQGRGMQGGGTQGRGMQGGGMQGCGMGRGQGSGAGMAAGGGNHHDKIHTLLDYHDAIDRWVKPIPDGVETITTSDDPEVARVIREHVQQMKDRMEAGQPMRMWDPLFVEIFRHHDEIRMEIEELPGGVRVRETSDNADAVLLIQQHAIHGVSEFVEGGFDRAHRATPLPDGYESSETLRAMPACRWHESTTPGQEIATP